MSIDINSQVKCPSCGRINDMKSNYCTDCGFQFKNADAVLFQIQENLKIDLYGSIVCLIIFTAFMVVATIAIISQYGLYGFISIPIIWPLTIGLILWARHYMKGLSKFRRFTITQDYIEFIVPHKPPFQIKWTEFESIAITKRESISTIPIGEDIIFGPKFVYFNLIFKGTDLERSYEFESGKDFKVRSRKKVLIALEKYAKEKGKKITSWKWKD